MEVKEFLVDEWPEEDFETCGFCGEEYPVSDLIKEKDMKYLCNRCYKALKSKGEPLDILHDDERRDDSDSDDLPEELTEGFKDWIDEKIGIPLFVKSLKALVKVNSPEGEELLQKVTVESPLGQILLSDERFSAAPLYGNPEKLTEMLKLDLARLSTKEFIKLWIAPPESGITVRITDYIQVFPDIKSKEEVVDDNHLEDIYDFSDLDKK